MVLHIQSWIQETAHWKSTILKGYSITTIIIAVIITYIHNF